MSDKGKRNHNYVYINSDGSRMDCSANARPPKYTVQEALNRDNLKCHVCSYRNMIFKEDKQDVFCLNCHTWQLEIKKAHVPTIRERFSEMMSRYKPNWGRINHTIFKYSEKFIGYGALSVFLYYVSYLFAAFLMFIITWDIIWINDMGKGIHFSDWNVVLAQILVFVIVGQIVLLFIIYDYMNKSANSYRENRNDEIMSEYGKKKDESADNYKMTSHKVQNKYCISCGSGKTEIYKSINVNSKIIKCHNCGHEERI